MIRLLHAIFLALFFLTSTSAATAKVTITHFHNDISGSPMLATDAAGNQVWKESYRPYGQKLRDEPASRDGKNKIGYAGSPFDASTGLSYMGARYYDPVIGRFMGVDPVGFQEGNVHSFNRYAYANNNPYKYVDRDGRMAFLAAIPPAISALTPVAYAIGTRIAMSSVYRFGMAMAAGEVGLVAPAAVTVGAGVAAKSAGQLGREGEALASQITGVGKNTVSFLVNGRTRIPDQVISQDMLTRNPLHMVEVKNVQSQSLTRQLRDNVDLVGPGGRVDVMLPSSARVTGPLQQAFDNPRNPLNREDLR